MMAAKHLAGVITPPQRVRRRGQPVKKTEVGCSESMQKRGVDTVAGGGGDHVPAERRGRLAQQEGRGLHVTHTPTPPRKNPWNGYQEVNRSLG